MRIGKTRIVIEKGSKSEWWNFFENILWMIMGMIFMLALEVKFNVIEEMKVDNKTYDRGRSEEVIK